MDTVKNKKKIRILGAGISGLVAGIILSKNGYEIEIFEKRPKVGSFFKKNVHSLRNYSYNYDVIKKYKKLGIKISNIYPIFKEFRFSPSSKYNIEIYSKNKPLFYNIIRGYSDKRSLDMELFKQAKDYGIQIYFNQNMNLNNSDIDIVATGARYQKEIGYCVHYKKISIAKSNALYFFINTYGYACILPFLNNEASIAISGLPKESKNHLKKRFNVFLKKSNIIKKIPKTETEIFGFGFFDVPKTAIRNGKLYVGEAAGFLDAATYFGLHYAIFSGYLAAKSIIKNKDYNKLWKESFGEELRMRYSKGMYLQKLGNKGREKIIEKLIKTYGKRISIEDYRKIYGKI